jgi:hypothetical protein
MSKKIVYTAFLTALFNALILTTSLSGLTNCSLTVSGIILLLVLLTGIALLFFGTEQVKDIGKGMLWGSLASVILIIGLFVIILFLVGGHVC